MPPTGPRAVLSAAPPWTIGSAVFHYLGPAFAVLLFARPAGVGLVVISVALHRSPPVEKNSREGTTKCNT